MAPIGLVLRSGPVRAVLRSRSLPSLKDGGAWPQGPIRIRRPFSKHETGAGRMAAPRL
jgi:hypothetical protein